MGPGPHDIQGRGLQGGAGMNENTLTPLAGELIELGAMGILAGVFWWAWSKANARIVQLTDTLFDMVKRQEKVISQAMSALDRHSEAIKESTTVSRSLSERLSVHMELQRTEKS